MSRLQTATPSSWRRVAIFDSRTVIDSDDDALLVHEDSYVGVRRNVPSSQSIADLRYSSKPVCCAAVNLCGNEGIGRRRGLGPAGSAPLERGGRDALTVPVGAVVERGPLRGLFVVDAEGTARLRWIRPGKMLDNRVEVLSGLRTGDRYVISPPAGFTDGTPVREG